MAAGNTFTPIATYTLPNSTTSAYTFSAISQSYTHLYLAVNGSVTTQGYTYSIAFNGNTSTYDHTAMEMGNFADLVHSYFSYGQLTSNAAYNGFSTTPGGGTALYWFPFYSVSTLQKAYIGTFGSPDYYETNICSGATASTAAITSLKVSPDGNNTRTNFLTGTTLTLYGILEA